MPKTAVVYFVVTVFALLLFGAFILVVMNLASEKVVSASVPIAIAALVGIELVFVFTEEPSVSMVFPVMFVRFKEGAAPAGLPFRRDWGDTHFLVARLLKENPKLADDAGLLYHHLLQKALFEWIALRHSGAWDVEHLSFDTGVKTQRFGPARGSSEPSLKLTREDLERVLAANLFAKQSPMRTDMALPPDTDVTVRAPTADIGSEGEIRFEHPLCTLTLTTGTHGGMVGIGSYRLITDISIDEAQERYWSENYLVRGVVSFNRLRVAKVFARSPE